MSFRFTGDEVKKLSDKQKDTIIDVVVAGALADGKVVAAEEQKLETEFRKIEWGRSESEMYEKIKASAQKIASYTTADQAVALIKDSASTLTDQGLREKAFALLARILYADQKMSESEGVVLITFAEHFQIPLEKCKEIAAAVTKGG
jgi:uncharacterized tellurite resistance protein B-like protein